MRNRSEQKKNGNQMNDITTLINLIAAILNLIAVICVLAETLIR